MALITCSECGAQISDLAPACPHCGAPAAVRQQAAQPVQQMAQPFLPQLNTAQRVGGKPPKARIGFQRFREALLIIALMCIGVILVCNAIVLNELGKFNIGGLRDIGDLAKALPNMKEKLTNTIVVSLVAGGFMIFILFLSMIFLFADRRAEKKIAGVGWLLLSACVVGMSAGVFDTCSSIFRDGLWKNLSENIGNCKGYIWGGFGISALVLFLIITVIVLTEKQIKEKYNAVQLS
ncbi:MAG: hypothetical protein K2N56_05700 [Oscillospiraceae bacterium]|nr:hypothetical protein [Oscillospiraceae bacterium]